jgi:hypothetical protein
MRERENEEGSKRKIELVGKQFFMCVFSIIKKKKGMEFA